MWQVLRYVHMHPRLQKQRTWNAEHFSHTLLLVQALLWSHYPNCSNDQIRFAMAYTAKDLDDSSSDSSRGCDIRFGNGLVQAKAALDFLGKYSCSSGSWGRNADLGGCNVLK